MKNIILTYKNSVKAIIKNITGQPNEDMEQEVYLRTWKNLDKYEENGKFKQWISKITANVCRDYLKSSAVKNSKNISSDDNVIINIQSEKDNIENLFEKRERQTLVSQAILNLKPKFREVTVMYEIDGMSYEEIASKLKCPIGTVKSRIFKARTELCEKLKDLL